MTGFLRSFRRFHQPFTGLLLVIALFILVAGKASENKNTLYSTIVPGMTMDEVLSIVGEPIRVKSVERYIYNSWGQVVIKNGKIDDIRILARNPEENRPLLSRDIRNSADDINKLRYLRIGTLSEHIADVAGKPDKILYGEDLYYEKGRIIIEISDNRVSKVNLDVETGLASIDWVRLNFSPMSLLIMNITIAFIMFGVALEIKPESFKLILKEPKSLILGIFSQFIALPALTFLLIWFIQPTPTVALGMILVAACPGGNVSNFMSSLAKGNIALSISLTAFATVSAVIMTPVNFAFWGNLYSETSSMVIPIKIDFFEILRTVLLLLGVPVVLGIWFSRTFPVLTEKIFKPVKSLSMIIFILFIIGAFIANLDFFLSYIHLIAFIVLAHNALALLAGFTIGTLGKTSSADRRSLSIETGIQNSGLGLIIIFNPRLFDGLGGMAFIAAWWGIWHIISGLTIAWLWSRKPLKESRLQPSEVEVGK